MQAFQGAPEKFVRKKRFFTIKAFSRGKRKEKGFAVPEKFYFYGGMFGELLKGFFALV